MVFGVCERPSWELNAAGNGQASEFNVQSQEPPDKVQFTIIASVQLYRLVQVLYTFKGFIFVLHIFVTFFERILLKRGFSNHCG